MRGAIKQLQFQANLVVRAGVIGLTTALVLSDNISYDVTVAAKHMPGDYDAQYASPWAGANYMPVSAKGTQAAKREEKTWPHLMWLARDHPDSGVHFQGDRESPFDQATF